MEDLVNQVPLLRVLPKVEQAKLTGELRSQALSTGEWWRPDDGADTLHFLTRGHVEVGVRYNDEWVVLLQMGPGDILGLTGPAVDACELAYRAVGQVELVQLARRRFQGLAADYPHLLHQLSHQMLSQSHRLTLELARTKSLLMAYSEELWGSLLQQQEDLAPPAEESAAATLAAPPVVEVSRERTREEPWFDFSWSTWRGHALTVGTSAAIWWLAQRGGFAPGTALSLAILVWGVLSWLWETMPDHAVALAMVGSAAMFQLVPARAALSGFASPTWLLLLTVLGIAYAVSRTGLLYRAALQMLRRLPPSYRGQTFALSAIGLLMAPFLPGVTGRQAMASRLALELAEAMRFKPGSRGSAGLAMACFLGVSCVGFVSLTGASITLLVWSYMPAAVKASLTWSGWLTAAIVPALVVFGLSYWASLRLFRPEHRHAVELDLIETQLRVLGPFSRGETITGFVLCALVFAFVTQPIHSFDPTWVSLLGFLVLLVTGVLDKDGLKKGVDWPFLLLTGGMLGLAEIAEQTGLVQALGEQMAPLVISLSGASSWVLLPLVFLLTAGIRVLIPGYSVVLLMTMTMTPVAVQLGYNPFIMGLVILISSSHFFVPQGNPLYLAAYVGGGRRAFTHAQVRPLAFIHAGITLVAVVASIPYWKWLGLIPW